VNSVLRLRKYNSIQEAKRDIKVFQLPDISASSLLQGTVIIAEGSTTELLDISKEALDVGGKAYSGHYDDHELTLLWFPHLSASEILFMNDSALAKCINHYQSRDLSIDIPLPQGHLRTDHTIVMGILNVTPDSFYDGGHHNGVKEAVIRARKMVSEGADIIDVGGESTRPGWTPISVEEELSRVIPVIEEIASTIDIPISIDTMKARVAREAVEAGASIVNDINGLRDNDMVSAIRDTDAAAIIMHMRGEPMNMHAEVNISDYNDVVSDVIWYLNKRIESAENRGIDRKRLIVDPGLGFGKTLEHNVELIRRCREIRCLGAPILMGASRKRFIGQLSGAGPEDRVGGSVASAIVAAMNGASIIRVHDVGITVQALRVANAIL